MSMFGANITGENSPSRCFSVVPFYRFFFVLKGRLGSPKSDYRKNRVPLVEPLWRTSPWSRGTSANRRSFPSPSQDQMRKGPAEQELEAEVRSPPKGEWMMVFSFLPFGEMKTCFFFVFSLLVLKGIYDCWNYSYFSRGLRQTEVFV